MSWVQIVTPYCDARGCKATTKDRPLWIYRNLRAAGKDARGKGWVVREGKDYCPEHVR